MKASQAAVTVAEVTSSQWGLVTAAQARMHGVTRLDLSRLASAGHLVRLAHGVYKHAGVPSDDFEDLRAAWLSTDPERLAAERLSDGPEGVVVSGPSAAHLHALGDLPADQHEFTTSRRRQTQRGELRYRQRSLSDRDVTIRAGLPVTTVERTIADLVEAHTDRSLVADVLGDAARKTTIDVNVLGDLLAPLADSNGLRRGDGASLCRRLLESARLDPDSLIQRIARSAAYATLAETARKVENIG
ncbi:type IV toxin-antitoxin system AbiEi family antitoxin domain-containing protein [Nocardioides sp. NPDC051685]|uniref:type IV toxin-antitoxin system AbiEi family antitoxin domain-containing protein n=1 Tax=Nocardioides sp. NPDC051685 TaxID=3364334 RepID=UPI00378C9C9D